jgi:hypothetical protein
MEDSSLQILPYDQGPAPVSLNPALDNMDLGGHTGGGQGSGLPGAPSFPSTVGVRGIRGPRAAHAA